MKTFSDLQQFCEKEAKLYLGKWSVDSTLRQHQSKQEKKLTSWDQWVVNKEIKFIVSIASYIYVDAAVWSTLRYRHTFKRSKEEHN